MNYQYLWNTIRHLKFIQVVYQVKFRLVKPSYKLYDSSRFQVLGSSFKTSPIPKYKSCDGNTFTFLNLTSEFAGWNFTENGMLWAYNQNYFDWINQEGISKEVVCKWIDKFIDELSTNKVGLDSYPIALRSINWIKFFCQYPDSATKIRLDSLYSQLRFLEKKLEYHLLGNHLLEDAYSLYIGAVFFSNWWLLKKAETLLMSQLEEQVLPDGAHYEQSPMYHCILLDRLLDCINIRKTDALTGYAQKMLGHLESIVWKDQAIPLLNDSAFGIAPTPTQIFDFAKRLGLRWKPVPMKECGYRKMASGIMEAKIDVGNITATYQPGHTHADTFNYELRLDGIPFVVDTGISTYNKTERRQLERSTIAHNCVSPNGGNSSEVWGGFRVGRRCNSNVESCEFRDESMLNVKSITAFHDGFGKKCRRKFEMGEASFSVEDWYDGEAVSYIHLAEGADKNCVKFEGALSVEVRPWKYSVEYNRFKEGEVIEIRFKGHCKYTIQERV